MTYGPQETIPPENVVPHLQRLLAKAIWERDSYLEELRSIAPTDMHWYCHGPRSRCRACGLPKTWPNHAPRPKEQP